MMVSLVWDDGTITRMKGTHALQIAQIWLGRYVDLLAVYCGNHLYLKEVFGK